MKATLRGDLKRLERLAFHRAEWGADLVRRIHRIRRSHRNSPDLELLEQITPWLFVPLTLWPVHLDGLARTLAGLLEAGTPIEADLRLLVELVGPPPTDLASDVTAQHEQLIQKGDYSSLIKSQHKFDFIEDELKQNPAFQQQWAEIKAVFPVDRYQTTKKILRRRMIPERNFRTDWDFRWDDERIRFQNVFDVFCWRWHLFGMRGDEPLLTKLTVNLTPYGTMIFIPSYWSFDSKRDIKWSVITALHKARGVPRQGPKRQMTRLSLREDADRAKSLWDQATDHGLRGKQRTSQVMAGMGWDARTDPSKLRRLMQPPRSSMGSRGGDTKNNVRGS